MILSLKGEITWFWHPGYSTGVGMGVDLFDYETRLETHERMVNLFNSYSDRGFGSTQMEILGFVDENVYKWTYYNIVNDQPLPAYSLIFKRGDHTRTPD